MGSVFKAERVDGEVAQTVAIKVLERGWLDPRAVDRFRQERQFLAGLSHPNIARLIDGGTRSDGLIYLAMEYVDGQRLDRYCEQEKLSITERLKLFLSLCDAVDHAHQKLIVHRDLKPSNILVNRAGEPKLIDFGVSKALDVTTNAGTTQTLVLTPDFASPEQVLGGEITVATDVYGLGAVLYFLLTGKAPHAVDGMSTAEMQRAVCEEPPVAPSNIVRDLKGDLENITLRALHLDPSRRYGSARELAEDIENYLAHRPVRATPDTVAYRFGRFVQRNRLASLAGALALLAILVGSGVSIYQAQRAQRRFAQVREMANKFVFEFEASIRDTPGTLAARRKMATAARQYLSDLAGDAGHDRALQRELAESYFRLSQIEANAEEYDAWLEHLKKSASILKALHDDCCGPPAQRLFYVEILGDIVHYWVDRAPKEAVPVAAEAMQVAKAFLAQSPNDARAAKAMIEATISEGTAASNVYRFQESRAKFADALRRADALLARLPDDNDVSFLRADAGNRLTSSLVRMGDVNGARETEAVSIAVLDPLIARHPENVRWRNQKIRMASSLATLLRRAARSNPELTAQILPAFREVYQMARENAAQNPGHLGALDLVYVMTSRYANQLGIEGKHAESLAMHQEAGGLIDVLARNDPSDHRSLSIRALNLANQGICLVRMQQWKEASAMLEKSDEVVQQMVKRWPEDAETLDLLVTVLAHRSQAQRQLGEADSARLQCRRAFEAVSKVTALNKDEKQPISNLDLLQSEAKLLGVSMSPVSTPHP